MKTKNAVLRLILTFTIGIALIVMTMMIFSNDKKEHSGRIGTLQLQADTPKSSPREEVHAALGGTKFMLKSVQIEIRNLRIKDNFVLNQKNIQSGIGGKQKSLMSEFDNTADSLLTGPYLLNILSGTATIDEVPIQKGTYKNIEFEFFAGTDNNNHSIALSGTFTNTQRVEVPFTLSSEFSEKIRLPFTGRGLKVNSGNIISITMLFDVNKWLNKLDFNTANQTNGQISITKDENRELYNAFLTQVSQHIDVEKEQLNN